MKKRAIAIVSGGLDSVTLAHLLAVQDYELHLLAFDYGQKHKKELGFARECAERLGAAFNLIDLTSLAPIIGGSALTEASIAVPHGHYAAPTMAITVVPNRNAIFLSLAFGAAVARGAQLVGIGVHGGDHFVYPDCRPKFIESFEAMQKLAVEGFGDPNLKLFAPFLNTDKTGIVRQGAKIGVPFSQTWSCYEGGELHCGRCGTCVERKQAFAAANVSDPTIYA
ncbi:MAG TPA: 7-cyano-7-deazaguanine synthase QueC [Abditibacterium sp.]|jgi:7-cyano-7-deazaguanine synthase